MVGSDIDIEDVLKRITERDRNRPPPLYPDEKEAAKAKHIAEQSEALANAIGKHR